MNQPYCVRGPVGRCVLVVCAVASVRCGPGRDPRADDGGGRPGDTVVGDGGFLGAGLTCSDAEVAALVGDGLAWASVQEAIEAAALRGADREEVVVCRGNHEESLRVVGTAVASIRGEEGWKVEVRAPWNERALFVEGGGNLTVSDLSIVGQPGSVFAGGGGLIAVDGSRLALARVDLEGGSATSDGGLLLLSTTEVDAEAELIIVQSVLSNGLAGGNGGIIAVDAVAGVARVWIADSSLSQGRSGRSGGVVAVDGGGAVEVELAGGWLKDGTAAADGGAIALLGAPASAVVRMSGIDLAESSAALSGGLVFVDSDERVAYREISVLDSRLYGGVAGTDGGGMRLSGFGQTRVSMCDSVFADNRAVGRGGALYAVGPELADAAFEGEQVILTDNVSEQLTSAAIHVELGVVVNVNAWFDYDGGANQPADLRGLSEQFDAENVNTWVYASCSTLGDCSFNYLE